MSFKIVSIEENDHNNDKDVSLSGGAVESRVGDNRDEMFTPQRSTIFLQDLQQRGRDGVPAGERCGGLERGWSSYQYSFA